MPTALCCSYAFMLPVATPPNAIAFGAAGMTTFTMVGTGSWSKVFILVYVRVCE